MRISDWSSDVCSSDLCAQPGSGEPQVWPQVVHDGEHAGAVPVSATRHAADAYIGIPFVDDGKTRAGVHCWGLLQMYYAEQLGITLPDYPLTAADRDGNAAALREELAAGEWRPVRSDERRVGKECVRPGRYWGATY